MPARILVVDDDHKITTLIAAILGRTGRYEVRQEHCSFRALDVAREFRPDLAVLDIDMPGKNGYEVSLEFSRDSLLAGMPVLFLTNLVTQDRESVLNTVSDGIHFMAKSPLPDALIERVARLLPSSAPGC